MPDPFLNEFVAKEILGDHFSEERGAFVASIVQSAREGSLAFRGGFQELPSSVLSEGRDDPMTPLVKDGDRYYLQKNWVLETLLLKELDRLSKRKSSLSFKATGEEEALSIEQKKGVEHFFQNPFSVLCGGPGTGKTHTIAYFLRALLRTISHKNYRILLSSPTGKAALHLQSSILSKVGIHCEAMTVHRLLNLKPTEVNLFRRERIDADLVIVDEASMMDASLFAHLLSSIGESTRIVLIGDPNQLPPVEGAGVFAEIADLYGFFLKKCMRTEDPLLKRSAQAILEGDEEMFHSSVQISEWEEGFFETLYQKISPLTSPDKIDPVSYFEESRKRKVLDMLRKGPFGIEALNGKILKKLSDECPEGWWWAVPIILTANLPGQNLYNGSTGVIIGKKRGGIDLSMGTTYFEDKGVIANPPKYELSFILSVHKSQGSEFDEIIALFPSGSERFGKEALYTAATRAKKKWEVIGERETMQKLLLKKSSRTSGLKKRSSLE